jgi:hypothetical protein
MSTNEQYGPKDLFLLGEDGKTVYAVKESTYIQHKIDPSMAGQINSLLSQGVVVAHLPTGPGVGAACYLVSLAGIKPPPFRPTAKKEE